MHTTQVNNNHYNAHHTGKHIKHFNAHHTGKTEQPATQAKYAYDAIPCNETSTDSMHAVPTHVNNLVHSSDPPTRSGAWLINQNYHKVITPKWQRPSGNECMNIQYANIT